MWKRASGWLRVAGTLSLLLFAALTALAVQSSSGTTAGTDGETPLQVEHTLLQAAMQSPDDFGAQQRLGEFYLQQNRLQQGILYLQKAQQLNAQDYNTGYDLSLAYLNSGDIANASTQLHTMIAQRETAELDDLLGEVNEKSGDYKAAASEYYRAAELDPSETNIFDLASFLLQHQNYEGFLDNALKFFQYGVEKYPDPGR